MKRIVTIQDISCLGKCSLTVALPVISAMGIETSIIPTAILSTHTIFEGYTFKDLTDEIDSIAKHWKKEGFDFDAIYTGYLGSTRQIDIVSRFFSDFKTERNFIYVDPVMADNGKLYPSFDSAFVEKMRELCGKADVISPNLTEAALLTGQEYKKEYDRKYIEDIVYSLIESGAKNVILTGVALDGKYGILSYDGKDFDYCTHEKFDRTFYGTGDVFSSACVGALTKGSTLKEAVKIAGDFTLESIKASVSNPDTRYYGVDFESALHTLYNK